MELNENRPIVLMANSSWYLWHYRKELIKSLKKKSYLITLSPFDKYSKYLEDISFNILWKIEKNRDFSFFRYMISIIKMMIIIRAIKPKLIHSHTIKTNLSASLAAFVCDIPIVFSFTGLGRLSKGNFLKRFLLKFILKIIFILSTENFIRFQKISANNRKNAFIFQNQIDLNFFYKYIDTKKISNSYLVYGSGIPKEYFYKKESKNLWQIINKNNPSLDQINPIYCGRLLKSKGIELFLEIAKVMKDSPSFVFGETDHGSKDSLPLDIRLKICEEYKNINFMGKVINPLLKINMITPVLIFPSNYGEGLSRTILEAMCLEIPVICSSNATSGVFNDELLYVANSAKVEDYLECIKRIKKDYQSNNLIIKLKKAKQICLENFREESIVKKTINIYQNITNYIY